MKQPDPQQGRSLSLELSAAEHAAILLAADEIPYQIHHAATIFEFLGVGHSLGTFDSKPDVIISRLASSPGARSGALPTPKAITCPIWLTSCATARR